MIRSHIVRKAMMFGLLAGITAQATPTFDPKLQAYLRNDRVANDTIRVIALFNDKAPLRRMSTSSANRLQVERDLIQNAMTSQSTFVQSLTQLRNQGGVKAYRLWLINAMVLELKAKDLQLLEKSDDIRHVMADYPVGLIRPVAGAFSQRGREGAYTYGLQKLQIPQLLAANPNASGKGVRVGLIDTGIDATHPDLKGKVIGFKDFVNGRPQPYDDNKHGTHCAGTIGGGNASGTQIGVAPGVQFIAAKFLDANGSGTFANAVAAMQWMADPDNNPSTDDAPALVSNSWGGGAPDPTKDPTQDPLCQAAASWVKLGIVPVFAAGNSGPNPRSVGLPGGCPYVVAVGATDSADQAASFSSRGPAVWKTGSIVKPEISAPGVKITSSIPGGGYADLSGTSMATPHVAGLLALVYQAHPKLEVEKAVQLLKATADHIGADPNTFGAGRVNALKSVQAATHP